MPKEKQKPRRLTDKQRAFVEAYLETLNATEAARRAGYKGNGKTLKSVGHENLTKPYIRALIDERLATMIMSANEVLTGITDIASGSLAMFMSDHPPYQLDMKKVKKHGHLLKKLSKKPDGGWQIEIYDKQKAQDQLGKYHQLFTDKVKVEGDINLIWDLTVPAKT